MKGVDTGHIKIIGRRIYYLHNRHARTPLYWASQDAITPMYSSVYIVVAI